MSTQRRERLVGHLDLANSVGLEIGPKDAPLVARADGPVRYVDYTDTESLKAAQDQTVAIENIIDVDIVWGPEPLRALVGTEVDYVVASHVIEHLPDLIGWLFELRQVLKPGGSLALAIPDRRFTFDVLRRESTLAEAIEAHLVGLRQPSIRQIFDAASTSVPVDTLAVWRGEWAHVPRPGPKRSRRALGLVATLKDEPRYIDAHCWVFTPASFLDLAEELAKLELFPYAIEAFFPTEPRSHEFLVRLTAIEASDVAAAIASVERARAVLAEAPTPPASPHDLVATLRAEAAQARAERDALIASTSWRITAPLRALAGWLGFRG